MKYEIDRRGGLDLVALTPKRGPKFDQRLADLDDQAARDVINGGFPNDRDAAKAYLSKYTDRTFASDEWEAKNDKIKIIAKRVKRRRLEISG